MTALPWVSFTTFCTRVLRLRLTKGQRVAARVVYDGVDPGQLQGDEREVARTIFGNVEVIPRLARRILVLCFGRNSGKTLIFAAAYGVYVMVYGDTRSCGPGDVPTVVVIAPRTRTARLDVRMGRSLIRRVPELDRAIEDDGKDGFSLRRPDGTLVAFAAYAASRGGAGGRGLPVLTFILDEAWFFLSDDAYAVTDRDCYRGLKPRLLPGGKAIFVSTPWPVVTMMGDLLATNFGVCSTAIAARAPTLLMRDNDPTIAADIEIERATDPDNAAREFDCAEGINAAGTSLFFDGDTLDAALQAGEHLVMPVDRWPYDRSIAVGADWGFVRNSSALAVAAHRSDGKVHILMLAELVPKKGAPLVPSAVVKEFAPIVCNRYEHHTVVSDEHYMEALREHLGAYRLTLRSAPSGNEGKALIYVNCRKLTAEQRLVIPCEPRFIVQKLLAQLKATTVKPLDGGGMRISSPTRAGTHGDVASAAVIALYEATEATRSRGRVTCYDPYSPMEGNDYL